MYKNYIKLALRNLTRNKTFSFINIVGLGIGIASCLLLFVVVKYELSYNKFQPDYDRIYHVVTEDKTPDGVFYNPGIPFPALKALRISFPEITIGALCANYGSQVTVPGEKGFTSSGSKKFVEESGFFFSDPEFFRVFTFQWLLGSPESLNEPNTTVLTQKMARKYFGNWETAVGKLLRLDNAVTVKVVGILKDLPPNTDYPLEIVTSFETLKANPATYFYSKEWGATTSNFQLFMLLPKNIPAEKINSRLVSFSNENYQGRSQLQKRKNFLQPLSEVHFDKRFDSFGDHVIEKSTLWTLSLIGIFIIVMACINFINLSTAQAVKRSKEIGIRKVLGGFRSQLFRQIMGETVLIVIVSVAFATAVALLCLPFIKHVASISEPLHLITPASILFLMIIIIGVTVLAGLYPAVVLSGFNPALALKNKITSATVGGLSIRRVLVISQFAISQVLIIGTIVAISQMNFVKNADLGFNKEALLIITSNADSIAQSRLSSFKQKLLQVPGIKSVSFSSDVPSSQNNSATNFGFDHKPVQNFSLYTKFADEDYFQTFGLQFQAGRAFDKSDTIQEVVINETLMKKLGISHPEKILGKEIRFGADAGWKRIVGVVKDFKTNTLKDEIKPLAIAERKDYYQVTAAKLVSSNLPETRAAVEKQWNETYPEYAFTSNYFDESIAEFYKQDQQLSMLYKIFAGIAILISCLGLYGLVAYMAIQKTKEIGVRKVLGASVGNIITLFSKEFTILILISSFIAIPVSYFMMDNWLQNFVFRIKMNPGIFVSAIAVSIVIAWIAVGYKSIKAAVANPVKSLRSE